jgi:ComEC/Rec2-related protein
MQRKIRKTENTDIFKYQITLEINLLIFYTIHFIILCQYKYISILFLIIFNIYYLIYKKKFLYLFCGLPAICYQIYNPSFIKQSYQVQYKICNIYKKNLYSIKISKIFHQKTLPYYNRYFFLRTKNPKEYFIDYISDIYIIKETFLIEKECLAITYHKQSYKKFIYNQIHQTNIKNKNIILATLLGTKNIPEDEIFKTTGTWHLLCVGGLHMNIIKNILDIIFRILGEIFKNIRIVWRIFLFCKIIILYIYTHMSNMHLPALRSFYMNFFHTYGEIKGFEIPSIINFFITFLLFLIYNPRYLFELGFQMSFLSVYFLINNGHIIYKSTKKYKKLYAYILNLIYLNIGISIILLPFSFHLHHYYNILSPLCNIISIPLFVIVLFCNICGFVHIIFWHISDFMINIIIQFLIYSHKYGFKIFFIIKKKYILYYIYIIFMLLIISNSIYYWYLIKKKEKIKKINYLLFLTNDDDFSIF